MKMYMIMSVGTHHIKLVNKFHIKVVYFGYSVQQAIQQNVRLIMIEIVDMNMQDEN